MKKYEYKVYTYDTKGVFGGKIDIRELESQLNKFGNEGWEMVSSTSSNQSYDDQDTEGAGSSEKTDRRV